MGGNWKENSCFRSRNQGTRKSCWKWQTRKLWRNVRIWGGSL